MNSKCVCVCVCDCAYLFQSGLTPLHLAAQEDKVNVAEVLLNQGADVDPSTKVKVTLFPRQPQGTDYQSESLWDREMPLISTLLVNDRPGVVDG